MDETVGLKLIEELKNDPEKFSKDGEKSYALLEEYFHGLSKETLRPLLNLENKLVRRVAMWIASELGRYSTDLMKEVVPQMNDDDLLICYYALQIVAGHAHGEYIDNFIRVFSFLEHDNQKIRTLVMHIISGLSAPRIHGVCAYLENKKIYNNSHKKGLLSLLNIDALTPSEITQMIGSDDAIIRKYGIIAATKLYQRYHRIIKRAVHDEDLDVMDFSRMVVGDRNKSDRIMSNEIPPEN